MLLTAFALLCVAALVGVGLAVRYLRGTAAVSASALFRMLHAGLGAAALALLLVALARGLAPSRMGTAGFGSTAAILLTLALLQGLAIARGVWRGQRPKELLVGTHAGLAIAGFVMLLTLLALG